MVKQILTRQWSTNPIPAKLNGVIENLVVVKNTTQRNDDVLAGDAGLELAGELLMVFTRSKQQIDAVMT